MFFLCHVRISEWIHTLQLPEFQESPWFQGYLKFKWLQWDSNPQPLSSKRTFWLNGWVFVYQLSGCGFEYRCSHYLPINQEKRKNPDRKVFLVKTKLNIIEVLISRTWIDWHEEFIPMNDVLSEYNKTKEEIKSSETSVEYTIQIWLVQAETNMKEMV